MLFGSYGTIFDMLINIIKYFVFFVGARHDIYFIHSSHLITAHLHIAACYSNNGLWIFLFHLSDVLS